MDARRNQVYTGFYTFEEHRLKVIREQTAAAVTDVAAWLNEMGREVIFLGDGVPVYRIYCSRKCVCRIRLHRRTSISRGQALWPRWERFILCREKRWERRNISPSISGFPQAERNARKN